MNLLKYKGNRIRASNKNLFFSFVLTCQLTIFILVVGLFNIKTLINIDWSNLNIDSINISKEYLLVSCLVALVVCLISSYMYYRFRCNSIVQLKHRQKLARMILDNKWYEIERVSTKGLFSDLECNRTKEKITAFPKLYYRMKDGLIFINVEITMTRYQEQLLNLENKLESGLFCELISKELKEAYIEYIFLYDTINSRISIDEVVVKDGRLRLMDNVYWNYDDLPHMLIAGGTGSGKTYFILTLIKSLLSTNATLYVLDPKNADLADLKTIMPNVYHTKDDMINCLNEFYANMIKRSKELKKYPDYKTGKNYAYLGLEAHFLVFDEYVAFMDMIGKESAEVISKLKQIVMLGRQVGFFLILACQRPDAKYLGDGIRDNFSFRVALGRMSDQGYDMMFGSSTDKQFFLKNIKGRGYVDTGTNVITEFYTPLVPKDYDFLNEISKQIKRRTTY